MIIMNGPQTGPAADQPRRRTGVVSTVLITVTGLLWVLVGFSAVALIDPVRITFINGIGDWDSDRMLTQMPLLVAGTIGIAVASLLGFAVSFRSTLSSSFSTGFRLTTALATGGMALGLLAAWLLGMWAQPQQVGAFAVDGFFITEEDGPEPWSVGGWIAYALPWALPLVLGAIALWCVLALVREGRGERRAARTERTAKHRGTMTPGTITHVAYANAWVDGDPQFHVTVAYMTPGGSRQATRPLVAPVTQPPVVGGQVDVWFGYSGDENDVLIERNERTGGAPTAQGYRGFPG